MILTQLPARDIQIECDNARLIKIGSFNPSFLCLKTNKGQVVIFARELKSPLRDWVTLIFSTRHGKFLLLKCDHDSSRVDFLF